LVATEVKPRGVGLTVPSAHRLDGAIEPVLASLLFPTFLGVPSPRHRC